MASSSSKLVKRSPGKRLIILGVLVLALITSLIVGTVRNPGTKFTPDLALDLEGGTQIILTPVTTDGSSITDSDVTQAIDIIRQRVDASGVAEAEISSQGGSNIVVALPGNPSEETLNLVRTSAVLRLRPVITMLNGPALTAADIANMQAAQNGETPDPEAEAPQMSEEELDAQIRTLADVNGDGEISSEPASEPADDSDDAWVTEKILYDAYRLQCGTQEARIELTQDDPQTSSLACDASGAMKYVLGPAPIQGTQLTKASSSPATNQQGTPTGGWAVNMEFNSEGAKSFFDVTNRIYQLQSPKNQFAIVLDGQVLSAPVPSGPINGGQAQITGSFTAPQAEALANQLSFGSLPLNFQVQSEEQISATLGSEQLTAGLIAGLIGLLLIVVYMLWQYHALGVVSVVSIVLSTGLSYLVVCLLSWVMGYRLSMAGVLGMIISVGVTADSFIVYFERVRDEIRDGRTIPGAIEHGWDRAQRTIIISDCVNLLASIVLYMLTVGSVRGFAFTLGITTVLDLIVVMMFTYPLMKFLMKTKYFSQGLVFSGLNERMLHHTPAYRGRLNLRDSKASKHPEVVGSDEHVGDADGDAKPGSAVSHITSPRETGGETLAQRKARERREKKRAEQLASASADHSDGAVE
ncbi:MAG: protein translocase subunit SecD [Arcanobacterium sp.]|nr:protein translocase subunit SecD [Arcanobacterium sp.]